MRSPLPSLIRGVGEIMCSKHLGNRYNLYYLVPGNSPKQQGNSTGGMTGQTQPK